MIYKEAHVKHQINTVGIDELAVILGDTEIRQSKDLGSALLHIGNHVKMGTIFIVTTFTEAHAYVTM